MFYLFFESRNNKKDPIVIWLTGGPGCSSELAVFYENGPFQIANNLSLVWNNYGWDKVIKSNNIIHSVYYSFAQNLKESVVVRCWFFPIQSVQLLLSFGRHRTFSLLTSLLEPASAIQLMSKIFAMMKRALAMTCLTVCRSVCFC
jgi:hypothetical protein